MKVLVGKSMQGKSWNELTYEMKKVVNKFWWVVL